jgi:hypothetical protein
MKKVILALMLSSSAVGHVSAHEPSVSETTAIVTGFLVPAFIFDNRDNIARNFFVDSAKQGVVSGPKSSELQASQPLDAEDNKISAGMKVSFGASLLGLGVGLALAACCKNRLAQHAAVGLVAGSYFTGLRSAAEICGCLMNPIFGF